MAILLDTCILIDYSKNHPGAVEYLDNLQTSPAVSALTITEILTGIRNKREKELFLTLFNLWEVFPVTHGIAELAGFYRQTYYKSHHLGVVDAIIAATAEKNNVVIITLNIKDFPMYKNLCSPY